MKPPLLPSSYETWEPCIRMLFRISPTPADDKARIAALSHLRDNRAQRFVQTLGEAHLGCVRDWFRQAHEHLTIGKLS